MTVFIQQKKEFTEAQCAVRQFPPENNKHGVCMTCVECRASRSRSHSQNLKTHLQHSYLRFTWTRISCSPLHVCAFPNNACARHMCTGALKTPTKISREHFDGWIYLPICFKMPVAYQWFLDRERKLERSNKMSIPTSSQQWIRRGTHASPCGVETTQICSDAVLFAITSL
jgi:hypothetical protein